jgi:hypothetical protein
MTSRASTIGLLALLAAVLVAAVLAVALLTARAGVEEGRGGGAPPMNEGALELVSRPDLHPASMRLTLTSDGASPGYLFVTPGSRRYGDTGPMIVDHLGQPVWVGSVPEGQNATSFSVQRYRGQPVLTWWEGPIDRDVGFGNGFGVILDSAYRRVATVHAGNGHAADLHDFVITARDTALLIIYEEGRRDLTEHGGARGGRLLDNLVQEVDIETGQVLFEWSAFEHVPAGESYKQAPAGGELWDPYHLNSVAMDDEGDFIVSARHTWAVYKIDRETGEVEWRLGGKASDFALGEGAVFAWQHDARWRPDGTLSLFDNQAASKDIVEGDRSRGLVLRLDEATGTATLVREFTHPAGLLAGSQGNLQNLAAGVLVGWGSQPHLSEYDAEGRMVFDLRFHATNQSYRAFRSPWVGRPSDRPAIVARNEGDGTTVYVSWNGSTEVASWRVLGASAEGDRPAEVARVPRAGFETAVAIDRDGEGLRLFQVQALDAGGRVIGASELVEVTTSPSPSVASPSPSVASPSPGAASPSPGDGVAVALIPARPALSSRAFLADPLDLANSDAVAGAAPAGTLPSRRRPGRRRWQYGSAASVRSTARTPTCRARSRSTVTSRASSSRSASGP